jgi:hypothetical protein
VRRVFSLVIPHVLAHNLYAIVEAVQVFVRIEAGLLEMIEQSLFQSAVCARTSPAAGRATFIVELKAYLVHQSGLDHPETEPGAAYPAGASLLRPMVMKKSDMSWKQASRTLSTMAGLSNPPARISTCGPRACVLLVRFPALRPDVVELVYLLYEPVVERKNISGFDICGAIGLEEEKLISYLQDTFEDRLFRWVRDHAIDGRVCHGGDCSLFLLIMTMRSLGAYFGGRGLL